MSASEKDYRQVDQSGREPALSAKEQQRLANLSLFEQLAKSRYQTVTMQLLWRTSRGEVK